MQQTLSIYYELQETYIPLHLQRLFSLLSDGLWHSTDEVIAVAGKQYNARIYELRKYNINIISIRVMNKFGYTYISDGAHGVHGN